MFDISISTIAWQANENEKVYKLLEDLNIEFLEITPGHISGGCLKQDAIKPYLLDLKNYGLKPIAMQALLYGRPELLIFKDAATRTKTLRYIFKLIKFSSRLGIRTMIFGSPKNKHTGALSKEKINSIAQDFFGRIGEEAKKNNLFFCIEPTPVDYGANYICNTSEAIDFVKSVGSQGLKVNIDLGSMIANNENIDYSIKKAAPLAGHFHISLPGLERIKCDENFHNNIAKSIRESGYLGAVSIEMLGNKNNNTRDLRDIIKMIKKSYGQAKKT